ncbi:pyridoxamine 5'-phosphate oxidase family protein [Olsenella massiliensis]|uniref:pyridoxamine 5'-phosphate oxidase family protein n=1 Tax=Olsenella massiliensis TaxID=1622075 RepID=UPI00071E4DD1|nr:pyridoxamine 5'-phosphate oxidase family protein [Olsenella massiliensis]
MRRRDREITDFDEIVNVMRRCDVCRIALNSDDYPYIVPLNFGMDVTDGRITLYFHSANKGTKLDLIARDARASFEMDCDHALIMYDEQMSCTMGYASVMGRGIIEVVPAEGKVAALRALMAQYHEADFPINERLLPATTVLKMTVTEVTGKRRDNVHADRKGRVEHPFERGAKVRG